MARLIELVKHAKPIIRALLSLCSSLRNLPFIIWALIHVLFKRVFPLASVQKYLKKEFDETCSKLKYLLVRDGKLYFFVYPSFSDVYAAKLFHEPLVRRVVFDLAPLILIDIGAHVGAYPIRLAKQGCNTVAVEADPRNYLFLRANSKINNVEDRVEPHNFVAYSKETKLPFYVRSSGVHSSIYGDIEYLEKRLVQARPVDPLADKFERVDLLLVDVEGSVTEVLKGADQLLRKTINVIIEIPNWDREETFSRLEKYGFRVKPIQRGLLDITYLCRRKNKTM